MFFPIFSRFSHFSYQLELLPLRIHLGLYRFLAIFVAFVGCVKIYALDAFMAHEGPLPLRRLSHCLWLWSWSWSSSWSWILDSGFWPCLWSFVRQLNGLYIFPIYINVSTYILHSLGGSFGALLQVIQLHSR